MSAAQRQAYFKKMSQCLCLKIGKPTSPSDPDEKEKR